MVSRTHVAFKAEDRSYFAILKKDIHSLAVGASFAEAKIGELDIIVAELVSNLVKHAGGGQVLVKLIEEKGMELLSQKIGSYDEELEEDEIGFEQREDAD